MIEEGTIGTIKSSGNQDENQVVVKNSSFSDKSIARLTFHRIVSVGIHAVVAFG